MSINELDSKVQELRALKRMKEDLEAEITAAEDSIKAEMTIRGVDSLAGNDWKITWKLVTGNRFDSVAFKKANPDVYAMFTKTTEGRRFVLA